MNIRPAVALKVRQVLEALAAWQCAPWMAAYAREALPSFRFAAASPRPRPAAAAQRAPAAPTGHVDKSGLPFAPPAGGPPKAARRVARNDVLFRHVRPAAFRRCRTWGGNLCEFCRAGPPEEAHHVLKGSEKVSEESEETLAVVCEACHKKTEASPAWARVKGYHWALRLAREALRRGLPELAEGFERTAQILEGKIALHEAKGITRKEGTDA